MKKKIEILWAYWKIANILLIVYLVFELIPYLKDFFYMADPQILFDFYSKIALLILIVYGFIGSFDYVKGDANGNN